MKEIYEFRVREKYAGCLFGPNEGKRLGEVAATVRKIKLSAGDPRLHRVGELNSAIQKDHNDFFFHGWDIQRTYLMDELQKAEVFLLCRVPTFEPAGEECGTKYDESRACNHCGAGAQQTTPLFLDWKRIPKSKDIARTIGGEIVVSLRLVKCFEQHSITGVQFQPIRHRPASSAACRDWFQLVVESSDAEVNPQTRTGINPFDEDKAGDYRCPMGDLIGLARLSEVWISRSSSDGSDIITSHQFVGVRRGLLRPERFLLVSPKLRRAIEGERLRGCRFEVAYLV